MLLRHDEHLVGRTAPVGAQHDHAVVLVHDAMAGRRLGVDDRAQQARSLEPHEPRPLLGDVGGHERHADELAVRMRQRRAGLTAVVDDAERGPHVGVAGVLLQAVAQRGHHEAGVALVEVRPPRLVIGRQHDDLVDAARRRLREHRPEVGHRHRVVARERGIQVGHDPHLPVAVGAVGLERGRRRFLVPGEERAGARRVGFDGELPRCEVDGAQRTVGGDRDPPPRQRVEAELAQRRGRDGATGATYRSVRVRSRTPTRASTNRR